MPLSQPFVLFFLQVGLCLVYNPCFKGARLIICIITNVLLILNEILLTDPVSSVCLSIPLSLSFYDTNMHS